MRNIIMYRKIYFVCFVMLFGLAGCVHTIRAPFGSDPDGDGDAKGAVHFALTRPATGRRVFIYDPTAHAWAAYDESGNRKNTGRASGGKPYCPDIGRSCRTTIGQYRIFKKGDSSCVSSQYPVATHGGAPMPYCMYFHPKGYAIHGTANVPDFYNSHGCIGVTEPAAEWLHDFLPIGSTVLVRHY